MQCDLLLVAHPARPLGVLCSITYLCFNVCQLPCLRCCLIEQVCPYLYHHRGLVLYCILLQLNHFSLHVVLDVILELEKNMWQKNSHQSNGQKPHS